MSRNPPILSTLTSAERAAWANLRTFARVHAAVIVAARWRDDVTDLVLTEILSAPYLLDQYRLAIGEADPHIHGSRRKKLLDQQIGRASRAGCRGVVRVANGRRVMRDASVGPHFRFTVLDAPPPRASL